MSGGVYKLIEVVGTSPTSFTEAVTVGVQEAAKTVQHMGWFEVTDMRGAVKDGKVSEYQVTLKIGFKLER
jgi:flavin-binding protein dodecin